MRIRIHMVKIPTATDNRVVKAGSGEQERDERGQWGKRETYAKLSTIKIKIKFKFFFLIFLIDI